MDETIKKPTGTMVAFGDVVQLSKERSQDPQVDGFERYIGLEHLEPSDLRVRSWGDISDGVTFTSVFRPGQVLFGKRRAYQRKVAVTNFSGVCSGDIYVLEPKGNQLLAELLPFICQSRPFYDYVISMSQGGLSPRVNWKALAKYELALPPHEEQRRIADLMLRMQGLLDSLTGLIDSTQIARSALFNEILRSYNPATAPLGDLLSCPPKNGNSPRESPAPTGHWVLALSAISRWGYYSNQIKPVKMSPALKAATLRRGDLVVSRSNTRELVGLPAVFPEDRSDISYPDTMMRLSFDKDSVNSTYMEMCLRSPRIRREVQSYAAGTSASMKKINGTNLSKVSVPVIPLVQQEEIVAAVSNTDRLIRDTKARVNDALSLKSQMLADALEVGANVR